MFDIGFGELALVFVIGLVVLGPERLPVAVRTVVGWIRALRSLASTVQNELSQELKLQELQDSLKKVEQASKDNLSPELKASMDELRDAAESVKKTFHTKVGAEAQAEHQTIHNPLITDPEALHDGVTPAEGAHQAQAPAMAPAAESLPQAPATATAAEQVFQAPAKALAVEPVPREPVQAPAVEPKLQAPDTAGKNPRPPVTARPEPASDAVPSNPTLTDDR